MTAFGAKEQPVQLADNGESLWDAQILRQLALVVFILPALSASMILAASGVEVLTKLA